MCRFPVAAGCDCGALLPSPLLHSTWVGTCAPWSPHRVPLPFVFVREVYSPPYHVLLAKSHMTCSTFVMSRVLSIWASFVFWSPLSMGCYLYVLWALVFEPYHVLHLCVIFILTLWPKSWCYYHGKFSHLLSIHFHVLETFISDLSAIYLLFGQPLSYSLLAHIIRDLILRL